MALEDEFLDMMPDTVTVYPKASLDAYGKRTWSASGTQYRCRIESAQDLARDAEGREVVITGRVFLYGAPTLTTDHKVVLPDGSVPVIVNATTQRDQSGAHHTMLLIGR